MSVVVPDPAVPERPVPDPVATPAQTVRIANIANGLTLLRLLLVPVFGWALLHDHGTDTTWRVVAACSIGVPVCPLSPCSRVAASTSGGTSWKSDRCRRGDRRLLGDVLGDLPPAVHLGLVELVRIAGEPARSHRLEDRRLTTGACRLRAAGLAPLTAGICIAWALRIRLGVQ